MHKITHVTLVVSDQQEALDWYMQKLGWKVVADMPFPGGMPGRWITIAPPGQTEIEVVLQSTDWGPEGDANSCKAQVGKQQGFVIATDNCRGEIETLRNKGVAIISEPEEMPWGVSAEFADLYGNTHNLLQPAAYEGG